MLLVCSPPRSPLQNKSVAGLGALVDAVFGLPVVMVWWLLFRGSPDPP
jgi:hypothetical protein